MINTWRRSDVSDNELYRGDLAKALGAIRAKTLVMPSATDLYFTPEDSQREARQIRNSVYREIPSVWGHRAGNPAKSPADEKFIATAVEELLAS